jgi:2-dehydropantoate 2-reductase
MRILVFGAGAVGQAFGGFLSRQHDVMLLGRRRYGEAIRRRGLRVSGIWGRHCFRKLRFVASAAGLRGAGPFDLVLVTVKSYDTPAAARALRKLIAPGTPVLALQNGLGNIEALQAALGRGRVLAGRVIFGVEVPAPGRIRITVIAAPTAVGETAVKKITPRVRAIARAFNRAGLPSVPAADVAGRLWAKVVYNAALNPLASLLGCHYGRLTEQAFTRTLMDAVIREAYAVAGRAGINMRPPTADAYRREFYGKLVPRTYNHHPSMLQDLVAGKHTEIGALNGAIVRLGRRYGVKTPVNRRLLALIRGAERR